MAEGQSDFKSINSAIQDRVALYMEIGHFLSLYHEIITVKCPPWEANEWNEGELSAFKFDTDMIDRVYYYDSEQINGGDVRDFNWYDLKSKRAFKGRSLYFRDDVRDSYWYDLNGRMAYKGRSLYFRVHFIIKIICSGITKIVDSEAYLTFDAQVFLKAVVTGDCDVQEIKKMMLEDGLEVNEASNFDLYDQWNWRKFGVPSLSFFCQLAVYENRNQLTHYNKFLPVSVAKDIEQFMKVRETIEQI